MPDDFSLDWNGDQIEAALEQPWVETNEIYGREATELFADDRWAWPNAPSPRDVKDLGQLQGSYQGIPRPPLAYDHQWNAEYALAVFLGAVFKRDSVPGKIWIELTGSPSMPARNVPKAAMREFDWVETFTTIAQRKLGGIK